VKPISLPRDFCQQYKSLETFKYEPKDSKNLGEDYRILEELYRMRLSPTVVNKVANKNNPE